MTWPSSDVPTTALDAGTDTPPRSVFLAWAQAFNQMRTHVTTFAQNLLASVDQAAARTTLGATPVGSGVFTAANQAAARSVLGAGEVGGNVFMAEDQAAARSALNAPALSINNAFSGFQRFGADAPWLRCKKITGTTAGAEGFSTSIAHGLTQSKVLSVTVHVWDSFNSAWIPQGYTLTTEREFHWRLGSTDIHVSNSNTNSGAILNAAIRVLIWYEE